MSFVPANEKGLQVFMEQLKKDTPFFQRHRDNCRIDTSEHGFFLMNGEEVVAYGFYEDVGNREAMAGWAVLKKYWGRGFGKQIVDKVINEAKRAGIVKLKGIIAQNNWRSVHSSIKSGFRVIDEDEAPESDKLVYIELKL